MRVLFFEMITVDRIETVAIPTMQEVGGRPYGYLLLYGYSPKPSIEFDCFYRIMETGFHSDNNSIFGI